MQYALNIMITFFGALLAAKISDDYVPHLFWKLKKAYLNYKKKKLHHHYKRAIHAVDFSVLSQPVVTIEFKRLRWINLGLKQNCFRLQYNLPFIFSSSNKNLLYALLLG